MLRTLLLWFLLAGVPLQGFASATMLLCGAQPAAAHQAMPAHGDHDHAAMLAAHGDGAAHHAGAHHDADAASGEHAGHAQCASAGACCTGAPLAPALPAAPRSQDGRCATVPFVPAAPAAVDLAGLERPPKSA
ncbi:hypothetical protein [Pseudoduganella albidiflava]|uniref:CopL family metal-binding regulatory protein n=1 Tax=Pseudoduganella albidiflava TaxID=321983 RepID=A0ABX5RTX7_9BURK|nr:hypothetical protein [Pseudoduganella albidiflava]QBI02072.1 hypothetical protein EYF70_15330 [Pseudoduganella albidiflava]